MFGRGAKSKPSTSSSSSSKKKQDNDSSQKRDNDDDGGPFDAGDLIDVGMTALSLGGLFGLGTAGGEDSAFGVMGDALGFQYAPHISSACCCLLSIVIIFSSFVLMMTSSNNS
jgi:hypothetical protein